MLSAIVGAVGKLGPKTKTRQDETLNMYLSVGGLTSRVEELNEHLKWTKEHALRVGDEVEVKIFESTSADVPQDRNPAEREEERERLRYEHAKETYLALRSKFETE